MFVLTIRGYQDRLPTSGIDVTKATEEKNTAKMFEDYVRARICENWKFWIFSLAAKPLFENFNRVVGTKSKEEFNDSLMSWLDRHCTLVSLRPALLNCLRLLSTQTSVLSKPELLPEEALMAAMDDVFLVKACTSDNDASTDADIKLE